MDNQVFYRVVAPTLATGSAFIGITTLGEDENSNFVGKLIETRNKEGNRLFRVIIIELVCARCKRLGKDLICQHLMGEIPYWQEESRHEDIELMMPKDIFLREMRFVPEGVCVSRVSVGWGGRYGSIPDVQFAGKKLDGWCTWSVDSPFFYRLPSVRVCHVVCT